MKLINCFAVAACVCLFASCKKELSLELANPPVVPVDKVKELQDFLKDKNFQLRGFYSDVPIDYVQNDDTVKAETNLWGYVSYYLKDDMNTFSGNGADLTVNQNINKMPGNTDSLLHRSYHLSKTESGIDVDFLDYQYKPLKYQLYKTGEDYFILSIRWKDGVTLFSRFEIVP